MNLQQRIDLLSRLGAYISEDGESWQDVKRRAGLENGWFIPAFVDQAAAQIANAYLQGPLLEKWVQGYNLQDSSRSVGIVMAGNIPMVGFHDLLCTFICGHKSVIKLSSKDQVLIKHLAEVMIGWEPAAAAYLRFEENLRGCDAFIATGSNNSSRYFEYYFSKYPNIIRKNRTSVAVLSGGEDQAQLSFLADDVFLYFGLGCRNVTQLYVPEGYDFIPLLDAFNKYLYLADHHRYKNNYDYNLALHLLNKVQYMTNGAILLIENPNPFTPVSQLNYQYYQDPAAVLETLKKSEEIQCVYGPESSDFGRAQFPSLSDYADGKDTMAFLTSL